MTPPKPATDKLELSSGYSDAYNIEGDDAPPHDVSENSLPTGGRNYRHTPLHACTVETFLDQCKAFRGDAFPAPQYRAIGLYLLTSGYRDKDDPRRIVLPRKTLETLVGKPKDKRGHFSAEKWIEDFKADTGWPMTVYPSNSIENKARTVLLDRAAMPVFAEEMGKQPLEWATDGSLQYFHNLQRYLPSTRKSLAADIRSTTLNEIRERSSAGCPPPSGPLCEYLNRQYDNSHYTEQINRLVEANKAAVHEMAAKLPDGCECLRDQKERVGRQIAKIILSPVPAYRHSGKTDRVFAFDTTFHILPRALRKTFIAGCARLDVRSCQLAVISRLWGATMLREFLERNMHENGIGIWDELQNYVAPGGESIKPLAKTLIYALAFGMPRAGLRSCAMTGHTDKRVEKCPDCKKTGVHVTGIGERGADRFLSHPLIADLLAARQRQIRVIRKQGGVLDAWGRFHGPGPGEEISQDKMRHLLARQAQSWEVAGMMSLLPVLESWGSKITVPLFLHDGIAIIADPATTPIIVTRLKTSFCEWAERNDVPACLDDE